MKITRFTAGAACLSATALVLVGCSAGGGQNSTDGSDGEISGTLSVIFDSTFRDSLDPIVAAFEEEYPDVQVEVNYQGGDIGPAILTQLQAGTAPDVLLSFPSGEVGTAADNVIPLAAGGLITPIEPDWADDIPEIWRSSVTYEDQIYAFPGAVQPLAAIYNQTFLDELGLTAPETLDEVLGLCAAAQDNGVYAYAQGLGDVAAGPQMLSFGQTASLIYGPTPDFDRELAAGDAEYPGSGWEEQFTIYQDMFDAGCFGEGSLGRSRVQGAEAVSARQALGIVDVGGVLAGIVENNADDQFVVAAIPATDDGENFITALPGYVLTVNAAADNPAAAKAFVEFAGQPEQSAAYAIGFSSVPIIPNDQYEAPENLADFAALVEEGQVAQLGSVQPEVQTTLNQSLQSMLLGNDTPASVAQKLQDAYQVQ